MQKELLAISMIEKLRDNIGKNIKCCYWHDECIIENDNELKKIDSFKNIKIGDKTIPFIGNNYAIVYIYSENGDVLYHNPFIKPFYNETNPDKIEELRRLVFGNKVVDEENKEKKLEELKQMEMVRTLGIKQEKIKRPLVERGLKFVNDERKEEFKKITKGYLEPYTLDILKAFVLMMEKIESGVNIEDAEMDVYGMELGLTGFQIFATAKLISYFTKNGEEYRIYRNSKHGIVDSNDHNIENPAVLRKLK